MPYKDKEKQKEANRLRMQKVRQGNTKVTQNNDVVLPEKENAVLPITSVKPSDDYPVIIHWLADKDKRAKLQAISNSLANRNCSEHVRFGVYGMTFDRVGELLTAF
jgi:hypothetical protein